MPTMESLINQYQRRTEQQILLPVNRVFEEKTHRQIVVNPLAISPSYAEAIQQMFPEQEREEKNIQLAKKSLGALATQFSSEELKNIINEIEFLTETWLDEFERSIFKGLTLQELLHEKGAR